MEQTGLDRRSFVKMGAGMVSAITLAPGAAGFIKSFANAEPLPVAVIGVGAVITLLSVGEGVSQYITEQFQSVGSNLLFVVPGQLQQLFLPFRYLLCPPF